MSGIVPFLQGIGSGRRRIITAVDWTCRFQSPLWCRLHPRWSSIQFQLRHTDCSHDVWHSANVRLFPADYDKYIPNLADTPHVASLTHRGCGDTTSNHFSAASDSILAMMIGPILLQTGCFWGPANLRAWLGDSGSIASTISAAS